VLLPACHYFYYRPGDPAEISSPEKHDRVGLTDPLPFSVIDTGPPGPVPRA